MEFEWVAEHHNLEARYWWFVNKRRLVHQLLNRFAPAKGQVLEVGTGGGFLARELARAGWEVISSDLYPGAARFALEHGAKGALAFDADKRWPFVDAAMDAFLMLDVLEHLEGDVEALREAHRILRPGAIGIVSVPAYPFLFSAWDQYNHHYRRYMLSRLVRAATEGGFHVRFRSYWNAISLPPAIFLRLKNRRGLGEGEHLHYPEIPGFANKLLAAYGVAECVWLRLLPVPCGLSAIVVIEKR